MRKTWLHFGFAVDAAIRDTGCLNSTQKVMLGTMEYLITEAQVRQLQQACPPESVQKVLDGLPRVTNVSTENDRTRRDEVSVWGNLLLALPRMLKVRSGSRFDTACSIIYKVSHEAIDILVFIGLSYGCVWGYDYIQSQWASGLTAGVAVTLVALLVAALSAVTTITSIVRNFRREKAQGFPELSGLRIRESQINAILRSAPPGFAIRMFDSLPVMATYQVSESPAEGVEGVAAPEAHSAAPEKPQRWWDLPVWLITAMSLLWLVTGSLLSDDPDLMAKIGSFAVIWLAADALIRRFVRFKTERVIAQRTRHTW